MPQTTASPTRTCLPPKNQKPNSATSAAHRRLRGQALADGRRAARQHGRRRVQARRASGLIFLKYISDAFEEQHAALLAEKAAGCRPRGPRRVPRPERLLGAARGPLGAPARRNAKQPTIGQLIDDAMDAIEKENPALKGVLPKDYARPALDKTRLGELIDLIGTIRSATRPAAAKDVLGRVYEYFLSQFASAEGKKGGEFYTPRCVVSCWSRCSSPTRAGSTTPAAARAACSCRRRGSSRPRRERRIRRHRDLRPGVELHHLAAGAR